MITKMIPAGMITTSPPANPTPSPTAALIIARGALRHMIPSAAPRNSPTKPATVGNSRRAIRFSPRSTSLMNGSKIIQATNAPSPLARLR